MAKQGTKSKKNSRTYNDAVAHIYATFNNTIINIDKLTNKTPKLTVKCPENVN
jgi:ribosomal protein S11